MPIKRYRFVPLLLLFMAAATSTAQDEAPLPLSGFDTASAIAEWKVPGTIPPTRISLNTDPSFIATGSGSARIDTPSSADGGPRWPCVMLTGKALRSADWAGSDELVCEAFNPAAEEQDILMIVKVEGGGSETVRFPLKPGRQTLRWKLPDLVRSRPVVEFQFFQNDPPQARTLYIDDLRLAVSRQKLADRLNRFQRGLDNDAYSELRQQADKLGAEGENTKIWENARKLLKLEQRFTVLRKELDRRLDAEFAAAFRRQFQGQPWGYGRSNAAVHVFRSGIPFRGDIAGAVEIELARREAEAAQIVLRSVQPVDDVGVSVGTLRNAQGGTLPAGAVTVVPVGYVRPEPAAYPVENIEWRPDPLLGYCRSFRLDADVWQPLWVEVKTGADTAPGLYEGTVTVSGKDVPALEIPLRVTVWNFTLPERMTLPTAFTYEANEKHKIYAENDAEWDEFQAWQNGTKAWEELSPGGQRLCKLKLDTEDMLLDHHITPSSLYLSSRPYRPDEVARWMAKGGNGFNIFYIQSIPSIRKGEPYPAETRAWLLRTVGEAVKRFDAAGLRKDAYFYAFDEISENQFAAAKDILTEVKRRWPDIPVITTAFDGSFGEKSGLEDVIDIWVPFVSKFETERAAIERAKQRGATIWSYTCMYSPEANYLLEQPASAPRLLTGLMQYKYGSAGFLYYQTTYWQMSPRLKGGPLTNHTGRSDYKAYNGDGMLLYPGPEGPVPSIRLKGIRDGLEDYEYLVMLEKLSENAKSLPAADRSELERLRTVPEEVVETMRKYDVTGTKLLDYRRRIGRLLDRSASVLRDGGK